MRVFRIKVFLTILFAFAFAVNSSAQKDASQCKTPRTFAYESVDKYAFSFSGKVSKIVVVDTDLEPATPREMKVTLSIDENGRLMEGRRSTATLPNFGKAGYTYDVLGRLVKRTEYNPNGSAALEYLFSYDADGRVASKLTQNAITKKVIGSKSEYRYESLNTYTEFSNGTFIRRVNLKRDDRCRIVAESWHKEDGSVEDNLVLTYDKKDNLVEHIVYAPSGEPAQKLRFEFAYDEFGNWIKRKTFEWHYWDKTDDYTQTGTEERTFTYVNSK